ncbi:MAG: addiction module protein [Burkholderiaceae bacterium]
MKCVVDASMVPKWLAPETDSPRAEALLDEVVEAEAMKLAPTERADLADELSLGVNSKEEVDAAWEAEIARRIQQIDSGEVECIPWEAVMTEMRGKLG